MEFRVLAAEKEQVIAFVQSTKADIVEQRERHSIKPRESQPEQEVQNPWSRRMEIGL